MIVVLTAAACVIAGMLFIGLPVDVSGPLRYFNAGILIGSAIQLLILDQI